MVTTLEIDLVLPCSTQYHWISMHCNEGMICNEVELSLYLRGMDWLWLTLVVSCPISKIKSRFRILSSWPQEQIGLHRRSLNGSCGNHAM